MCFYLFLTFISYFSVTFLDIFFLGCMSSQVLIFLLSFSFSSALSSMPYQIFPRPSFLPSSVRLFVRSSLPSFHTCFHTRTLACFHVYVTGQISRSGTNFQPGSKFKTWVKNFNLGYNWVANFYHVTWGQGVRVRVWVRVKYNN